MTDLTTRLETLRRPRLLVDAARHGLAGYKRDRDLRRIAGRDAPSGSTRVLKALVEREEELECIRQEKSATYSAARHVEVLVALMAESREQLTQPFPPSRGRRVAP